MSYLDSEQIRLRLTKIPFILAELRKKRRLVTIKGVETFQVQFDSHTFNFTPDTTITVGKSVADCLISDGRVIVGPPLDGPVHDVLEVVGSFNLSRGESSSPTQCPACHQEQGTTTRLIKHLATEHADPGTIRSSLKKADPPKPEAAVEENESAKESDDNS